MSRHKISNNKKRKSSQLVKSAQQEIRASNFQNAEELCQEVLEIDPESAEAFHMLGMIAEKFDQNDAAKELFIRACQIEPTRTDFLNNLGVLNKNKKEYAEALRCFDKSSEIDPKQADVFQAKAVVLIKLNQYLYALSAIQQSLALDSKNDESHRILGAILSASGEFEKSKLAFERTVELNPNHPRVYHDLAILAFQEGKLDLAEEHLREAIRINPNMTECYESLSIIKRLTTDDIGRVKLMYENKNTKLDARQHISFTLGRVLEDKKKYSEAFGYLTEANNIIRNEITYNVSHDHITFYQLKETFSQSFINQKSSLGSNSSRPIFIVGMPRSGTSLVEQIIASHPNVHGIGESDLMLNIFQGLCQNKMGEQSIEHLNDVANKRWLNQAEGVYLKCLINTSSKQGMLYTDKTPSNFFLVGLIHILFPNARIIHCKRNAMDNCLSIYKENFAGGIHKYAYNLEEMGEFYLLYKDLMAYWNKALPKGAIYELEYEKLVQCQEEETSKLLKHCRLEWSDACLNFHQNNRVVRTASGEQVRQPIYKTSIEGWKRYEKELMPLAQKLGYAE